MGRFNEFVRNYINVYIMRLHVVCYFVVRVYVPQTKRYSVLFVTVEKFCIVRRISSVSFLPLKIK